MKPEPSFLNRLGKKLLAWVGLGGAEAKMRTTAENWLETADKVWNFRRDVLPARDAEELRARTDELRLRYRTHADASKLQQAIAALEPVLKRTGGAIYPKTALIENVEFILVAAIVIIGVRSYILQPFKIPTNSMWPSYYGMTPDVYPDPAKVPSLPSRVARFVLFGARHHELVAPDSGSIKVPVSYGGVVLYETKPARSWLIFPSTNREYIFDVNGKQVKVQVPQDFDLNLAFPEAFGMTTEQLAEAAKLSPDHNGNFAWVTLPRQAVQGRAFFAFDEITGDQLFADRISYHFMRPQVGQGFVFFTGNIPGIMNVFGEQYYIKRLVGVPGDTLEVRPPVLWRDGAPITGTPAFDRNAQQIDHYAGYVFGPTADRPLDSPMRAKYLTAAGDKVTVPANSFFAMGDNSNNSFDSRYWGFVPAKEVVGRPLFIYFPFSKRWGPAR
ncbi:MAG: signal peptidase I [Opitutaceae bacterium]